MCFDLEFEPDIGFCDLDGGCRGCMAAVSMVCSEFKLDVSLLEGVETICSNHGLL